jgi:hypothetical protein
VEEARKIFGETQQKMDEKMDAIYKLMSQWNNNSEMSTPDKPPHRFPSPPTNTNPSQPTNPHMLTAYELAFLKKQEVVEKISLQHEPYLNTTSYNQEASASDPTPLTLPNHQDLCSLNKYLKPNHPCHIQTNHLIISITTQTITDNTTTLTNSTFP